MADDLMEHLQQFRIEVQVGMDVAVRMGMEQWIVRITGLYNNDKGFWFKRFYRIRDLFMCGRHGIPSMGAQDERQLFLDEYIHREPQSRDAIDRVVSVKNIPPGNAVQEELIPEHGYWFMHTFSHEGYTIADYDVGEIARWSTFPLKALDLYCGCGGLSFVTNPTNSTSSTSSITTMGIVSKIGVDTDKDACYSYKLNHQKAHVHNMKIQEFVFICKHLDALDQNLMDTLSDDDLVVNSNISDVRLKHLDGLENTTLEFCMGDYWVLSDQADTGAIWEFLKHREEFGYPTPEGIDLIMGGPPCQDLSYANSRAPNEDIMHSSKNQEVVRFYDTVEYFQPSFVLMENVPNIMRTEAAVYFKYSLLRLINLGYQVRAGVVAAGDHGAAQVRKRCFIWGAKSGKVLLPAFPKPLFKLPEKLRQGGWMSDLEKMCLVGLKKEDYNSSDIFPMITTGDLLGDLPLVSPFSVSEVDRYSCGPLTPMMAWLRRELPDAEARWTQAEHWMGGIRQERWRDIQDIIKVAEKEFRLESNEVLENEKLKKIGWGIGFFKGQSRESDNVRNSVRPLICGETRRKVNNIITQGFHKLNHEMGKAILEAAEAEWKALDHPRHALMREHVTTLTSVEYERIRLVPLGDGGSLTSMEGVLTTGKLHCAGTVHSCGRDRELLRIGFGTDLFVYKQGCDSRNKFLSSGEVACPSYVLKAKRTSYRRIDRRSIIKTLLGKVDPAMRASGILHPQEHRCMTVLECKRIQGFPDKFYLVGTSGGNSTRKRKRQYVKSRYQQIGNAVSPHVAEALGRCLISAARGGYPKDFIEDVSDASTMKWELVSAVENGLKFSSSQSSHTVIILPSSSDSDSDK